MELANVKRMDWRKTMTAGAETPPEFIAALDKYFEPFAEPVRGEERSEKPLLCIKCDEPLTGMLASMFGKGGFTWGMVHGEGHCAGCGWPARAHHYITDKDGSELVTLRNVILQYHPDVVEAKQSAA